jgi:uncharacterized protein (TIGR01777 family)
VENLKAKKILVTGGTGFVGKALCQKLSSLGAEVIILSRRKTPGTIQSLDQIGAEKIDMIVNLAGETIAQRWTTSTKEKIRRSRIDTTKSIIDFIQKSTHRPGVLVSASAIGYYGVAETIEFNESTPPLPKNAPYSSALCKEWETEAFKAEKLGVRTVALRIGAVLGKGGGMIGKMLVPFQLGLGGPIGHGRQWLSWIDLDDLVGMIIFALTRDTLSGSVNALSPTPVRNKYFAKSLARFLGRRFFFNTPAFFLKAAFADMAH